MRRDIFTEDHELFRRQVRRFVEKEIAPQVAAWNARGMSDRDSWRRAVVAMAARSEPAPGSVMATPRSTSPDTAPGAQRRFCSSVP